MCRYNAECDDVCPCLHGTPDGAVTDCCNQLIPEDHIGIPSPKPYRYAAVCDVCGVLRKSEGRPTDVKVAVRNHEESHTANWGVLR